MRLVLINAFTNQTVVPASRICGKFGPTKAEFPLTPYLALIGSGTWDAS
ncbi:hypothetical protein BDD14_1601 [Edaphobacter modestus]|uniref:Uncharacterized protein n=1 Tax=Edaphobacter modestus TaxID=388466 RepID=A0A4Q7YR56_9BACT|nr:hypothetical protein BDD14_1601 [Edaphobacter modestus]